MDAWTLRIKHRPKIVTLEKLQVLYLNINEYQKSWMFRWIFQNLGFFSNPSFRYSLQVNIEKTDV